MTQHLKLRIHISEPWDFDRIAGTAELSGWTTDHADTENEAWEVHLDESFEFHDHVIGRLLAAPRYVGEHLARMFDAVTGFPVRLAYRHDGAWHYAFIGMISQRHVQGDQGRGGAQEETGN
ncbi:MAG: hypothetical protein ABW039_08955 [Sphingobium sp.]